MYLFCQRCVIAVLIVLTQQLVNFACGADVTYDQTVPAKVATSFFKVPWINLSSPWADGVTTQCRNDVTTIFKSADVGEMWALQMLDASSRIPSGILMGNIIDLGMYDECIRVKAHDNSANIQGQHCMITLSVPSEFVENAAEILYVQKLSVYNPSAEIHPSLTLSLCLPSSCGVPDVVGLTNASIQTTPELADLEVTVFQAKCSLVESADDLTVETILIISFFVVIASILLFCTVCDFVVRATSRNTFPTLETLAKFSLYRNTNKLLSTATTPGSMPAINGIRFLSTCLIVLLHRMLCALLTPLFNLSDIYMFKQSMLFSTLLTLPYVVDTFFLLSGFLATHSYLKRARKGVTNDNVLDFYLHRYIRLAPSMCVSILVIIFIVPYLGGGPIWESLLKNQIEHCRKNWWANLLFVQNFSHRDEMCIPHAWYSAVEMQFFLLSPIILYPLFHRRRLGLTILSALSIAALIIPAAQIFVYDYSFLFTSVKTRQESWNDFFNSYTITYNRALPYLIGIFLGYDVVNNRRRFTKVQVGLNWILACIFLLFCFWNTYFIQPNTDVLNVVSEAIHVSFGRLGWSLAILWILYACTHGYGGPVERFLSLPIFVPLSRLSYNIYLVHFLIQGFTVAIGRTPMYLTTLNLLYIVCGDLVMSIFVAFILNVCIETPALILEEVVRAKPPTAITNSASTTKQKKLSTTMSEYSDLSKGQVDDDLVNETQMPDTDFWRTMSDALNILSKRPTRTPAEWAKTWRDWRKSTQQEKDNKKGAGQFQTSEPTLAQELLIFLVAEISALENAPSSKKSDIAARAKSGRLNPNDLDDGNIVPLTISDSDPLTKKTS